MSLDKSALTRRSVAGRTQKTDINQSVCSAESPGPLGTPQSELEVTQARGSINTDPVTVAAVQGHLGPSGTGERRGGPAWPIWARTGRDANRHTGVHSQTHTCAHTHTHTQTHTQPSERRYISAGCLWSGRERMKGANINSGVVKVLCDYGLLFDL